ncbi:hypothetical protein [Bacillus sp. V59.32b]|uniref:hypothetical protein n=1 Tax=Bacillus sp. V59.32b TaxID=1758642 RepID=UPI000E3EDCC8|nr:hypothetical protein [Bacillus sp. V59.32b]RFU66503.1 hypothetical protein D0463_09095 [Bacillus sp. V59.32b]
MDNETNVCFHCKRLVTFIDNTCPKCAKPKKLLFEKQMKERKTQSKKEQETRNKNELIRLRNLKISEIQWEYIKAIDPSEHELNKIGAYGWELVATYLIKHHDDEQTQEFIFKRKLNK